MQLECSESARTQRIALCSRHCEVLRANLEMRRSTSVHDNNINHLVAATATRPRPLVCRKVCVCWGGGGGGGLLTGGDILTGVKRSTDTLKLGLEKSETPQ